MAKIVAGLDLVEPLTGHNQSTQYLACFQYPSSILEKSGSIKIEIALREPLLLPARHLSAHTLLRDPFSREEAIEPFFVQAIAFEEACAEKTRAALSRREPAIRDFFDLDFAVRNLRLDLFNGNLLQLIKKKLSVSGNEAVDVSLKRKQKLAIQVGTQLGPVLREQDFREFDLERAFDLVRRVAGSLEELPEEKPPSSKKPKRK